MQRKADANFRIFQESQILEFVTKALQLRTLLGKAA